VPVGAQTGTEALQGRFTRSDTNDVNYRVRAVTSWDVRQQTEYGTLRTYIRFGVSNETPGGTGGGSTPSAFWDRAFMQFAGFTVGRSQSFFDLFTYGGAYSYHNVRVSGDTGASGQNLWAYTAQFGNGFSGTLSLEDPATRKGNGTLNVQNAGFIGLGTVVSNNGLTINPTFGFRVPDVIANLRVDQAWGFAGISAALHDASGAYYGATNNVNNGHPEDKYGWALAGGAKFNLPGGDMIGFNVCYGEGAAGMCTNQGLFQLYDNSNKLGLAWIADGVYGPGTQIELTRTFSALAGYEHIWNPKWRTAIGGGYVNVDYTGAATNLINAQFAAAGAAACGVAPAAGGATIVGFTPGVGNSCNPDYSFWEAYTRTQWNPTPQLDIGLQVMYTHNNTAYKGAIVNLAANGARPALATAILDDQNVWSAMFRWQRNFYP
jgi:Porin subfamily